MAIKPKNLVTSNFRSMTMMSGTTTLSNAIFSRISTCRTVRATSTGNPSGASSDFVATGCSTRGFSVPESYSLYFTLSAIGCGSPAALRQLVSKTGAGIKSRTSTRAQELAVGLAQMAEEEKLPVLSVDWLHEHLHDPDLKVLDASWYMPFDKRNPLQEYKESHIPGAIFFDIDAIVDTTSEMPHMLPSEAAFSAAASALGLRTQDKIIVYDGKGIFSAARVWWMFRAFGHDKVWVLDGGLPQWLRQNYSVESAASSTAVGKISAASEAIKKIYGGQQVDSGIFKAELQHNLVLSLDEVKENIAEKKYLLVDARSKARFDGSAPEPRQGVKGGHVPGSTCVPFTEVLTNRGTLLPAEDLVGKFQQAGVSLDSPVAVSCGTGVTACILALALFRLGKADIPVYDGSWTEWGLAPNVPVETNV